MSDDWCRVSGAACERRAIGPALPAWPSVRPVAYFVTRFRTMSMTLLPSGDSNFVGRSPDGSGRQMVSLPPRESVDTRDCHAVDD